MLPSHKLLGSGEPFHITSRVAEVTAGVTMPCSVDFFNHYEDDLFVIVQGEKACLKG